MPDRESALEKQIDKIREQMVEDFKLVMLGLSTQRDSVRRTIRRMAARIDRALSEQSHILEDHVARQDKHLSEIVEVIKRDREKGQHDMRSVRKQIRSLEERVKRLEGEPPAA